MTIALRRSWLSSPSAPSEVEDEWRRTAFVAIAMLAAGSGNPLPRWSKAPWTTPERKAFLMGNFAGRGFVKIAGVIGADPVRLMDGIIDVWKWLVNFVARRLGKSEPYKSEPLAIVTSAKGEPVETALVEPQSKRVTALVPATSAALEEARADAEEERRRVAGKEEIL